MALRRHQAAVRFGCDLDHEQAIAAGVKSNMYRNFSILILLLLTLAVSETRAQDATPIPTPTPASAGDLEPVPAIAPDYRSDERRLPDLGRVGVDMTMQRTLTLQDAVELALQNNKDIEVSRKTLTTAEFELRAARGFYQKRLTGQSYYERSTTPNVSIFSNNQKTTTGSLIANAGLQGFVPQFGTVYSATFSNQRLTTDNPISILSPQFNSSLNFSVTQPLFRGRRFDQPRRTIEIARRNIDITDTQFRQRSIEAVAAVEKAYWDLAFALRNLQVQRDAVRDANSQLAHNRRLVDEGQLAPIDIVAAETQVANFEQAVYDALNIVNQAENLLKNLVAPNRTDPIWEEALTPVDPVEIAVPRPTLADAMETAIDNRPELAINRAQKDINSIDQKLYRDQKKPQIDVIGGYTSSGIGGSQNPNFNPNFPTPCAVDPTSPACAQQQANLALLTGSPFSGILANRYPVFRFGIQFNLPLFGDKTASAQLGRSQVEASRLETQREQIEQGIQVEVRNAMQAIRTAEARLRSAAIARENLTKQYESEQRKLDEGQSDIYKVLERLTALASARSNELRARTELNKAIAEFERATGNTLKANNIEPK
jgi:HAE1 family hydrophobic/amphiphilic exporter-1